jgi:hypothetical protein
MAKAETIIDRRFSINERYTIVENVLRISSAKYPEGIKAAFLLLDVDLSKPRLLVDNSETPHEFHMHTALPDDKDAKVFLGTYDYREALRLFYEKVERIIDEK